MRFILEPRFLNMRIMLTNNIVMESSPVSRGVERRRRGAQFLAPMMILNDFLFKKPDSVPDCHEWL